MTENIANGLLISPIRDGTVIDHIPAGEALKVLSMLGITGTTDKELSIATNVGTKTDGVRKDIVKISNKELSIKELNRIALIAPKATINIIRDFKVVKKTGVKVPEVIEGVLKCPNPGCITNTNEPIETKFIVKNGVLHCAYCDNIISSNFIDYIL